MAYKIFSNPHVNQKDYVRAHMTKDEIQGMEALQGHFTSIDKKTGLREFSHLLPIFENHEVLNTFERLQSQLSEFGKLSHSDLNKYNKALSRRPKYIETATEAVMSKFGRGKDKHLVLLPKPIAEFFIKINKGHNSRNPKTGYLEFGRGKTMSMEGMKSVGFKVGSGGTRNHAPSGREGSRSEGSRSDGNMVYGGTHFSVPTKEGYIDFPSIRRERPDLQSQTDSYILKALAEEEKGRQAAAAALHAHQEEQRAIQEEKNNQQQEMLQNSRYPRSRQEERNIQDATAEDYKEFQRYKAPHALISALQYGATLLGFALGGPSGAAMANMTAKALTNEFTPDMPTRAAVNIASDLFENPMFSKMFDEIGDEFSNRIPTTPQEQLSKYLTGNLRYYTPGYDHELPGEGNFGIGAESRRNKKSLFNKDFEYDRNIERGHPRSYAESTTVPTLDKMIEKLKTKYQLKGSSTKPKEQESTFSELENDSPYLKGLSQFDKNVMALKQKNDAQKMKNQGLTNPVDASSSVRPLPAAEDLEIRNNAINPQLSPQQRNEAIALYKQKNQPNELNPFEVQQNEEDLKKNAYREYYQQNATKLNPRQNPYEIYG